MSFLPIYRLLNQSSDIAQLINVESRVFEDVAPDGTAQPYVVWQALSGDAENFLDAPANNDRIMYQVKVYATDQKTAYQLRDSIRAVLEQHSWILNPSINDFETDTKLYVRGFDAEWILQR